MDTMDVGDSGMVSVASVRMQYHSTYSDRAAWVQIGICKADRGMGDRDAEQREKETRAARTSWWKAERTGSLKFLLSGVDA